MRTTCMIKGLECGCSSAINHNRFASSPLHLSICGYKFHWWKSIIFTPLQFVIPFRPLSSPPLLFPAHQRRVSAADFPLKHLYVINVPMDKRDTNIFSQLFNESLSWDLLQTTRKTLTWPLQGFYRWMVTFVFLFVEEMNIPPDGNEARRHKRQFVSL